MFNRLMLSLVFICAALVQTNAQRITYTEPEREDTRRTNFEIIGKLGSNYLVFKNNRSDNAISVYDTDMKLVRRVKHDYMPDRVINVDFVTYPDFAYMVYQYQKKNIVYCMGVKIGADGKKIAEPVELDTTQIGSTTDNKIYTTLVSEDKKKIMALKINSRNTKKYIFTSVLMNDQLVRSEKHSVSMTMDDRNDYFTDFYLANTGDLIFGKCMRGNGNDNINKLMLIHKPVGVDSFETRPLDLGGRFLDEIKIKIDNLNKQYLLTAFYYKSRRGNIDGIYTMYFDQKGDTVFRSKAVEFNDELRALAKGESNLKMAFNDYFIKTVIPKIDGGFFLAAESSYTTSRGYTYNRWDYMNWRNMGGIGMMPSDYYFWNRGYSPWGWNSWRYNNSPQTRYHADNIMVLSFNEKAELEWSNVIPKTQFDDESDFLISYASLVSGGQIKFLFNELDKRTMMLSEQSVSPDGQITRSPTIKNLDKGYEFLPKFAKQVGGRQMIFPCFYRNYICFAKVDF